MVVMSHGCLQLPIDIACDSRMNQLADQQQLEGLSSACRTAPGGCEPDTLLELFLGGQSAPRERGGGQPGRYCGRGGPQPLPVLATSDIRSKTRNKQLCKNPYRLLLNM